uniref:Reverse transcriptase domain-containing protein n=1 Tax=Lactuca sativa TaxID=4236 RepID=A0A9R1X7T9_LACSA|nr:hypothetical protein LSAT_V11C600329680 [Lactuca sativa]
MINELYFWAKKVKKTILMFKVDFDKAFDSVNWEFLILFNLKWDLAVNGDPGSVDVSTHKGPRQGDPLSPFLFIIPMVGLNTAMLAARGKGISKGIQIPNNGPIISHLFYVDDALFVGEWTRPNLKNLARILKCFHILSGHKYLELVLRNVKLQIRLIFSDVKQDHFHSITWEFPSDKVVAPKSEGGLGVGSIRALNMSLIVKWWWRLKEEKESLWGLVIKGIHNLHNKSHDYLYNSNFSGVRNNIVSMKKDLLKYGLEIRDVFKLQVKSGVNTQFWTDKWLGLENLKNKFPALYEI